MTRSESPFNEYFIYIYICILNSRCSYKYPIQTLILSSSSSFITSEYTSFGDATALVQICKVSEKSSLSLSNKIWCVWESRSSYLRWRWAGSFMILLFYTMRKLLILLNTSDTKKQVERSPWNMERRFSLKTKRNELKYYCEVRRGILKNCS